MYVHLHSQSFHLLYLSVLLLRSALPFLYLVSPLHLHLSAVVLVETLAFQFEKVWLLRALHLVERAPRRENTIWKNVNSIAFRNRVNSCCSEAALKISRL